MTDDKGNKYDRGSLSYIEGYRREINELKSFLRTHNDEDFKVYHNSFDNYIWIVCNGTIINFNGITSKKYLKIYNQIRFNIKEEDEEENKNE